MRVSDISFQLGVRGLMSVNLGVLDMKQFENQCAIYHPEENYLPAYCKLAAEEWCHQ